MSFPFWNQSHCCFSSDRLAVDTLREILVTLNASVLQWTTCKNWLRRTCADHVLLATFPRHSFWFEEQQRYPKFGAKCCIFCFCISCYSNFKSTRGGTQGPTREAPLHMHWFHCLHACGTTFYQVNSTQKWSFCLWVVAMPISERCKVFALAESAGALITVRHCIGRCDMVSLNLLENLEISFSLILATP